MPLWVLTTDLLMMRKMRELGLLAYETATPMSLLVDMGANSVPPLSAKASVT